jgi:iron(III) transport system ATP-binding protein
MTSVRIDNISKSFGQTVALDGINLAIAAGELFFLLGPSGCGKSTLLRLIAGLHEPTSGRIWFNDRDVTALSTERRNAVMCFQSYALWPHMSVKENIRFGLGVRGEKRAEQDRRVGEVLELVRMSAMGDRKPNELSGGQQQRVALARALAVRPDCLLLDEPLSNLDAKLRLEMRTEIRRICKSAGCTTIYVTHDQKEALSTADRLAVLKDGRLMQVGTPAELYQSPNSSFVADFVGQTNLLKGTVVARRGELLELRTSVGTIFATSRGKAAEDATEGSQVIASIRPEQIRVSGTGHQIPTFSSNTSAGLTDAGAVNVTAPFRNQLGGTVVETTFLGESSEHVLRIAGEKLRMIAAPPLFDVPEYMGIEFDAKDVILLSE